MALKPWHLVIQPRADLQDGRAFDASEFAVELDAIRKGQGHELYRDPAQLFERTFFTRSLKELTSQVLRRLSGETVESSAVFSLVTQFGGGKTHAMAMLYHLAKKGQEASSWRGVDELLRVAEVARVPSAEVAIFVGTYFDPVSGRTDEGITRYTPWGEIAWQLGGREAFEVVAEHDRDRIAPAGDVIKKMLPEGRPVLILMDELMSFVGRDSVERKHVGMQLYHFVQSLSEVARASRNVVLVASLQSSPGETTPDEVRDLQNFKHMFNRVGRSMVLAAEDESAEIIRRRLFDTTELDKDAMSKAATAFADALEANRTHLPTWFPVERAKERFLASYPFHPSLLSVFERKWGSLPKFQQTRGMLRVLALWVSRTWRASKDPLITLGSAPLRDPIFRRAVLDQLNEDKLETVIITDIDGRADSIATRLDAVADGAIGREQLHRKVATAIFFESNGGQALGAALQTEINLAMIEPAKDVMNIQTALDALTTRCHYLIQERIAFRFSVKPNLNKMLADQRENIKETAIEEHLRKEVREVFANDRGLAVVLFPSESSQVPDLARVTFAVLPPSRPLRGDGVRAWIEHSTRECGSQVRTYKTAVFWVVAENVETLYEKAQDLLAYDVVAKMDNLGDGQREQLRDNYRRTAGELRTAIWRAYNKLLFLGGAQGMREHSLGALHPSGAKSFLDGVMAQIEAQQGLIEKSVSPAFLIRKWPPALPEWSTRAVRDVFFQSPEFPRLLHADAAKDVIARGVSSGDLALVTRRSDGGYTTFKWKVSLTAADVDIDDDTFVIRRDDAQRWVDSQRKPSEPRVVAQAAPTHEGPVSGLRAPAVVGAGSDVGQPAQATGQVASLEWAGEVPALVWGRLYTKLLAPHIQAGGLALRLTIRLSPEGGLSAHQVDEFRQQLRALGLDAEIRVER